MTSPFTAEATFWKGAAARSWSDQHDRSDHAFAELRHAVLAQAAPLPGECVLDIGCGGGTTVLELAAQVGPAGAVVGADIAEASIALVARRLAGMPWASAVCADVTTHPFPPGSFDLAFSQLGVMFFPDPVAAMANVRRAMAPDGRLAFGVFRAASENVWPGIVVGAVKHLLDIPPPPAEGPAMFGWADQAKVRGILSAAGFRDIGFVKTDITIHLAAHGGAAEAAEFAMLFGPLSRLLPGLPAERLEAVRAALVALFEARGTRLPGAFQVVLARA